MDLPGRAQLSDDELIQSITDIFEEFALTEHPDEEANAKIAQEMIAILPPEKLIGIIRELSNRVCRKVYGDDNFLGENDGF